MGEKITYDDVEEYMHLFSLAPPFILRSFARKNSNFVAKFKSSVQSHLDSLTSEQRNKLHLILESDTGDLQALMAEAYQKTHKKQFKILADPKYRSFIELNINELRKMV